MKIWEYLFSNEFLILVEFEINAETIGDLKEQIEDTIGLDVDDWRLFQFGFLLPDDPGTKLEDFLDETNDKLKLNLVCPEEPPRDGKPRLIKTDKTRFLVRGERDNFEIIEIKPKKNFTIKFKQSYHFFGKQTFGIVTSILGDSPGERQLQCDIYEVKKEGYIVLKTDESDNDQVFLMEEGGKQQEQPFHAVELKSRDVKSYNEKHIISPKERREMRVKYVETLFAGISAGSRNIFFLLYIVIQTCCNF